MLNISIRVNTYGINPYDMYGYSPTAWAVYGTAAARAPARGGGGWRGEMRKLGNFPSFSHVTPRNLQD